MLDLPMIRSFIVNSKGFTMYRKEYCQLEVWRDAVGSNFPLYVFNDPEFGALDAPMALPAGSSVWRVLVSRGTGSHTYGATSTKTFRG